VTAAGAIARLVWGAIAIAGLSLIVAHHVGYFRKRRPLTFGAFLETTGWIIVTLFAIAAFGGGLVHPGTRAVEIAAVIVGLVFVLIGARFT